MKQKGILSKDHEKFLAKFLDEKIKLKGFWEKFDATIFRGVISLVDNYAIDRVKDDYKESIASIVQFLIDKEYELAAEEEQLVEAQK